MSLVLDAETEIAILAEYPQFRFFMTGHAIQDQPQWDLAAEPEDCDGTICNKWVVADSEYLRLFSAMCYMTVRDIAKMHLGSRPVGLVQTAWCGTRIESWMSAESIQKTPYANQIPTWPTPNVPSGLYNAMIAPWQHFPVRALLW